MTSFILNRLRPMPGPICVLLALFSVLLTNCTNDPEQEEDLRQGDYISTGTRTIKPAVMYTSSGKTTDVAIISAHLKRKKQEGMFELSTGSETHSTFLALHFASPTAVRLSEISTATKDTTDTMPTEVVSYSSTDMVLAQLDSVMVINPDNYPNADCGRIAKQVPLYKPTYHCRPVSIISGSWGYACRYRPLFPIQITKGQLSVVHTSWLMTAYTSSSYSCGTGFGNQWNSLNPAVINQLQVGDTLVVQERETPLVRK
ncbi:hypothetical protein LRS06_04215 [Hymenobacter sp. J193]|uniref:hypothetical protein n=1 Tax=Hymenobacter sp. J193 TaxID=2898429 RepID=UPI002151C898|nr:hypothetical protein [Hymenobacter sp. J193]MCR5886993.1 hypothetical protein [Hymenobacter sp. J193]